MNEYVIRRSDGKYLAQLGCVGPTVYHVPASMWNDSCDRAIRFDQEEAAMKVVALLNKDCEVVLLACKECEKHLAEIKRCNQSLTKISGARDAALHEICQLMETLQNVRKDHDKLAEELKSVRFLLDDKDRTLTAMRRQRNTFAEELNQVRQKEGRWYIRRGNEWVESLESVYYSDKPSELRPFWVSSRDAAIWWKKREEAWAVIMLLEGIDERIVRVDWRA